MAKFLFSYRVPNVSLEERINQLGPSAVAEVVSRWNAWFESMGESVLDRGNRVIDSRALGACNGDMRPGGYTVVGAENLEAAVALAAACPGLQMGGGVEVGVLQEPAGGIE